MLIYTQPGEQPSLGMGGGPPQTVQMWNLSSGNCPLTILAFVPQKPPAFCSSSIILPRAFATRIGYIRDTSLWNFGGYNKPPPNFVV